MHIYKCKYDVHIGIHWVIFLTGPPLFSTKMKKGLTSQPEALSDEGFHGTAALVGSLPFFILALNRWAS